MRDVPQFSEDSIFAQRLYYSILPEFKDLPDDKVLKIDPINVEKYMI